MALDFTTWCGFNFRSTLANATDGTNEIGIYGGPSGQTFNGDYGFLNPSSSPVDDTTNTDRRVRGRQTFSTAGTTFGINAPNGNYDMRLAYGALNVANTRTGVIIVDSIDSDFRNNGVTGILAASGNVTLNKYYVTSDSLRVYKATTGGTYTGDPVGTGTNIKAGAGSETARFSYLGNVIKIFDSGATPTINAHAVVDVDNTMNVAGSAWPTAGTGGTQPKQASIAVANGGVSVMKHPNASCFLCHIALKAQTTPLQAVDLRDAAGTSLGSNPSIHAGQPTGKLIAQLYFATGSAANITLGGTLASYFQVVTFNGNKWLASLRPMPDGTTGTLQVIQTDASSAITGSPFTTTFSTAGSTLTIVSSQGKPTSTVGVSGNALAYALMSTQCWLNHKLVRTTVEAAWDGYSNQALTNDIAVSDSAGLTTALTTINAAIGVGVWQRIRITAGTYSDKSWTSVDYSQGGTGGLIVQGTGAHTITGTWDCARFRGVHFDNLTFSPGVSSSLKVGINGTSSASTDHEVVISNCTFGTDGNTGYHPIDFFTGKSLKVRNCTFLGFDNGIKACGVRCVEVGNCDFTKFRSDIFDVAIFDSKVSPAKNVLTDNHQYVWFHDNAVHDSYDDWGSYVTDNEPHTDALQIQETVIGWVTATVYAAGTWVANNGRYYSTTAGGTSGATAPTHSDGSSVSDGGVTWKDQGALDTARLYLSMHGNRFHASSTTYSDLDAIAAPTSNGKFIAGLIGTMIDSSRVLPNTASAFNNIAASRSQLTGWTQFGGLTNPHYVECNTFTAPAYVPDSASPGPNSLKNVIEDTQIQGSGCYARKNIVGVMGTVALDEDNLEVPWQAGSPDPGLQVRGPTATNGVNSIWGFPTFDETLSATAFKASLESFLAPLPANAGYGATSQALGGVRNGSLSLRLGLGL